MVLVRDDTIPAFRLRSSQPGHTGLENPNTGADERPACGRARLRGRAVPILFALLLAGLVAAGCGGADRSDEARGEEYWRQRSQALAQKLLILDTHIDLPDRLTRKMEDVFQRTDGGDFDFPRARAGGLNATFLSIYVQASYQVTGGAKAYADQLIDLVEGLVEQQPGQCAIARSPAEVRSHFADSKISFPLGIENGAALEQDLDHLKHFYDRGVRYITLAHSKSNLICDSSYDKQRRWNGVSPYGYLVIEEMNRLGMIVDVSHLSDQAFFQVMDFSRAPAIASHSSCRRFTPGWERNMSDEMIRLLAEKGGVIQINFGSDFVNDEYRRGSSQASREIARYLKEKGLERSSEAARIYSEQYRKTHNLPYGDLLDVVEQIDHVVRLVGIDHVGLGSDFDGLGDSLPTGLKSVADYPNLLFELLKRGYSEEDIEKICSGNTLRVWSEVEEVARRFQEGDR